MWYGRKEDIDKIDQLMQKLCTAKMAVKEKDSSQGVLQVFTHEPPSFYKKVYAIFLDDGVYAFAPRVYITLCFNDRDNKYEMRVSPKGFEELSKRMPLIKELASGLGIEEA